MAKANPSVILLKSVDSPNYSEYPLVALDEVYGTGAITPGMLVETVGGEVQPHSVAGGNALPLFAVEGLNIDPNSKTLGGIDAPYNVDGQAVKVAHFRPGDHVYAFLAAGQDAPIDGLLQSNGDGYLAVYSASSPPPLRPIVKALEHVDNDPGTDGLPVRIKCEVV